MALLLCVLAVLQYRWVGQLSTDERERLRSHADTQAENLTDDFNRELTRAFFWLQFGAEQRRDVPLESEVERYARWYAAAPRPEIVKTIYRLTEPASEQAAWTVERFARDPARLEAVAWPAELEPIRSQLQPRAANGQPGGQLVRIFPAWAAIPALLIPRVQPQERADGRAPAAAPIKGYTVAVLDRTYLEHELLPQLVERHFRLSQDPSVYVGVYGPNVAFTAPAGQVPAALRTAPDVTDNDMFEIRFFEFRRFVTDRRLESPAGAAGVVAGTTGSGGTRASSGPPPPPPAPTAVIVTQPRGNVFRGRGGPGGRDGRDGAPHWNVHVLHRAGSLDIAVSHARLRNLLVSFGVLLLLCASMGLVLVTTGRAQRLAAQQIEFVAGVSHELRTPLAVIRSAAENLADGVVADPKQVKRYGDVIAGEGRRLTQMVEQIMEFAGFESGRATLDVRPADLGGIIEDALRGAEPMVREHRATIERRGMGDLPAVLVDPSAVSRSLQNLIVNALKYGGAPPAVVVETRPAEGGRREVAVTITDNGAGIAPRDLPHIFEPFYRGGDATARQIHGSGLGLSLVKRVMDEVGGRITVRTDAGKGSAFTLHLPVAPEGAREIGPADRTSGAPGLGAPRITTS